MYSSYYYLLYDYVVNIKMNGGRRPTRGKVIPYTCLVFCFLPPLVIMRIGNLELDLMAIFICAT